MRKELKKKGFILVLALCVAQACSNSNNDRRLEAIVLIDDNRKRCEALASGLLDAWRSTKGDSESEIMEFYSGMGALMTAGIRERREQILAVIRQIEIKSQLDETILDFHAGVERLCNLASSPGGYSQMTFNSARAGIRDDIAESKVRLQVSVPIPEPYRQNVLAEHADPVRSAQDLALETIELRKQREEKERARLAAAIEAERLQAEKEERERRQLELEAKRRAEEARTRELEKRRQQRKDYVALTIRQVQEWHGQNFAALKRFAVIAEQLTADWHRSNYALSRDCAVLKNAGEILVQRNMGGNATEEISDLVDEILTGYIEGAGHCLNKSVIMATSSFSRAGRSWIKLRAIVREYNLQD